MADTCVTVPAQGDRQFVFHLHGFDHYHTLPSLDRIADLYEHLRDSPGHRCHHAQPPVAGGLGTPRRSPPPRREFMACPRGGWPRPAPDERRPDGDPVPIDMDRQATRRVLDRYLVTTCGLVETDPRVGIVTAGVGPAQPAATRRGPPLPRPHENAGRRERSRGPRASTIRALPPTSTSNVTRAAPLTEPEPSTQPSPVAPIPCDQLRRARPPPPQPPDACAP